MKKLWPVALLGLMGLPSVLAQTTVTGARPEPFDVLAENGAYKFEVVPREVFRPPKPGETSTRDYYATGTLWRTNGAGGFEPIWSKVLVNPTCPVRAQVSNRGYTVTFDDFGTIGTGPNVVVLYSPIGNLIKQLPLEAFVPVAWLQRMKTTRAGRWWRWQEPHTFDDINGQLRLRVCVQGGLLTADKTHYETVAIDLFSGRVVVPMKDPSGPVK